MLVYVMAVFARRCFGFRRWIGCGWRVENKVVVCISRLGPWPLCRKTDAGALYQSLGVLTCHVRLI
jgi:hypothetical protein